MAPPICTLIHISDPHFGGSFVIDGESKWWALTRHIPILRHISGVFPHGYQSALQLAVAVRTILGECRENGVPAIVVHTGDLIASGSAGEFSVGTTFLRHGHQIENGQLGGLRLETEHGQLAFDIPGNHDLWRRKDPKKSAAFNSHYGGAYPLLQEIPNRQRPVRLHGLDSNRSPLWQHRLANGAIDSASFTSLRESLREGKKSGAIQVVCLHHPLSLTPETAPSLFGFEVLKLQDRETIARELASAGADIVLTGHIHHQQFQKADDMLHFTAGSACQIGSHPSFWRIDVHMEGVRYEYLHMREGSYYHFQVDDNRSGWAEYCSLSFRA